MNKDQVEGRAKEAAGKVQEVAGKAVGSTTQQVKGAMNKAAGTAQAKYGDVKNEMTKDSKQGR
ncbi:MAG: CsbD family protein [Pseudomonadota bacterium]|nr:CsbD family protein [Pseudomonadota bacterium]